MKMNYAKALKCAVLSQEIYGNFEQIKFKDFADVTPVLIDRTNTDTQCAILLEPTTNSVYIVFRGTEKRMDWDTDFNFGQQLIEEQQVIIEKQIVEPQEQVYPYAAQSRSGAKMHKGFINAYISVRDEIHKYLRENPISSVTVTGHSLGGALATLCAVDIQFNFSNKVTIDCYTFGAPRVGNNGFRESFNQRIPNSYRVIYGMDIVPALPRPWQGYHHVDKEYRIGSRFSLNFISQRFRDHAIGKYIEGLAKLVTK